MLRKLILLVIPALMLTACIQKPKETLIPDAPQKLQAYKAGQVVHLVTEQYPPYGYMEGTEIRGIAVDVVTELFHRLEIPMELELLPWTRALKMTQLGETDGIFTTFYSEERSTYLDFIKEPLAAEAQFVYVQSGRTLVWDGTLASLSKYRIGVLQDYFLGDEFEKAKKEKTLNIEQAPDMNTNVQKLLDGRIDLIIDHHLSMLAYLKKANLLSAVDESPKPFRKAESLHLCFSKARRFDPALLQKINDELVKMKQDGSYDRIVNSYIQ